MITRPAHLGPDFAPDAPARHLMRHLSTSVAAVAPERTDRLQAVSAGLTLVLATDERWVCYLAPETKEIHISIGTMTVLWCFAHAYLMLHQRIFPLWFTSDEDEIDLTKDPDVAAAMKLLSWAIANFGTETCGTGWTGRWPEGTPRPIANPAPGTMENVADELSLVAADFLLHHELAHAYLNHTSRGPGIESVEQEQDADREAAWWMLSGRPHDAHAFTKRALGVATALATMTALGIHSGYYGGSTHPRHFDRLRASLQNP